MLSTEIAILALFGYLLIGATFAGLMTRRFKDDTMLPVFLIVWPLTMPVVLLIFIYCVAAGKEFR